MGGAHVAGQLHARAGRTGLVHGAYLLITRPHGAALSGTDHRARSFSPTGPIRSRRTDRACGFAIRTRSTPCWARSPGRERPIPPRGVLLAYPPAVIPWEGVLNLDRMTATRIGPRGN